MNRVNCVKYVNVGMIETIETKQNQSIPFSKEGNVIQGWLIPSLIFIYESSSNDIYPLWYKGGGGAARWY